MAYNEHYLLVALNLPIHKNFIYSTTDIDYEIGACVLVPFGSKRLNGFVIDCMSDISHITFSIKSIIRFIHKKSLFNLYSLDLAKWVSEQYLCSLGEALFSMFPGMYCKKMENIKSSLDIPLDKFYSPYMEILPPLLISIKEKIHTHSHFPLYLMGPSGSGKTSIIFHIIKEELALSKQILYLCPDVYTAYLIYNLWKNIFKFHKVLLFHSQLKDTEKRMVYQIISTDPSCLVIGIRGAIFLPFKQLAFIFIEEEHSNNYKNIANPYYHVRSIAFFLSQKYHIKLILSSATPSVQMYYFIENNKIPCFNLTHSMDAMSMSTIKFINVSQEKKVLSGVLVDHLMETKSQGKQSILYINRKGFSYFLLCSQCNYECKCPHCRLGLTLYHKQNNLVCNYCSYQEKIPEYCPQCRAPTLHVHQFGIEYLHHELNDRLPEFKILNLSLKEKIHLDDVIYELLAFQNNQYDILLTTQNLIHYFHWPHVQLIGIILADIGLNIPDFYAGERVYTHLKQIMGRNRSHQSHQVLIQSLHPQHWILQSLAQEVDYFYHKELEQRKELGLPPYFFWIRIHVRGKKKAVLEKEIQALCQYLSHHSALLSSIQGILGPSECFFSPLAKNYRFQIFIKSQKFYKTHTILRNIFSQYILPHGIKFHIDINPHSVL